jgi:hypothetical protein
MTVKLPPHALRLSTYAELDAYVRAFAAGHLHLLLLFGPPGVGKSRCLRQALDQRAGWLSGQATPLGIYLQAYEIDTLALLNLICRFPFFPGFLLDARM